MIAPDEIDPYYKLRPEPPTPEDEICQCADQPPIVLQDHLSSVPLACLRCNGEIPPERIGFDADFAERIAFWRNLHRALITLWLDSGDYEDWARLQLQDPQGQLNSRGLEIVAALNATRRTYYGWFQDVSYDDPSTSDLRAAKCPRCYGDLSERFGCSVCEACSILVHRRDE
jgi:Zn-ribbon-containing, possibly nucleic-acid-binding protein (DUF2310)